MWTSALTVIVLMTTGTVAGILSDSVLAGIPTYRSLSPSRYVWIHQLIDRHYEPTMPVLVFATIVLDATLALVTGSALCRALYLAALLALLGVAVVSQFAGVRLLRRSVRGVDPDDLPDNWRDPRPAWRRWHLVRTALVFVAFAVTAVAAVHG